MQQKHIIKKAKEFSTQNHDMINHQYGMNSYSFHLQMVYDFAMKYIHLIEEDLRNEVLASCWMHDDLEDCYFINYNDIKVIFGEKIAEIVYACTNEKGRTRKERANEKYYEGIRNCMGAAFVKICDRLANASYSKIANNGMKDVYKKENENFKNMLYQTEYDEMFKELETILT